MEIRDAYVCEEKFTPTGKCVERKRSVGGIVVLGIVVIVLICAAGRLPPEFWSTLKPTLGALRGLFSI
jgi:hypothetical protein